MLSITKFKENWKDLKTHPFKIQEKIEDFLRSWTIVILIAIPVIYTTDPGKTLIDKFLKKEATDSEILIVLFSTVTILLLAVIFKFGRKSEKILDKIETSRRNSEAQLINLNKTLLSARKSYDDNITIKGTFGVYEDVEAEIIAKRTDGKIIIVDILGYTLFSVSSKLRKWQKQNKLKNITFNLHYLEPEFIQTSDDIDDDWKSQCESYLKDIKKFKLSHQNELEVKNVSIHLLPYKHIPAVHGFKVERGSMYMSLAEWDDNFQIAQPHDDSAYLKIEHEDQTLLARQTRRIFDNWLKKAKSYGPSFDIPLPELSEPNPELK